MTKRNPPILPPADPLGSDEWHDIQQSVGALDTQVKANEKKKSKESGSCLLYTSPSPRDS